MTKIILQYRHSETVNATVDPSTREVTFQDEPVTGKMFLISPAKVTSSSIEFGDEHMTVGLFTSSPEPLFVEIFERSGRYFLEPAA